MNIPNFASRHHAMRASRCAGVSVESEFVSLAAEPVEPTQNALAMIANANKDFTDLFFICFKLLLIA